MLLTLVVAAATQSSALLAAAPECWSAAELQSLAARIEADLAPNYKDLAFSPQRLAQVIAKGLLRELHACSGGAVRLRDHPQPHVCGELARGVAAPPRDRGQCDALAEQRARTAAAAVVANTVANGQGTLEGKDGWRHAAYMP